MLSYVVNRQGLDITLLAEPSSDEEEVTTKRKKHTVTSEPQRRRKPAITSMSAVAKDKENKTDVTAPQVSANVVADTVSHTVSADSRPVRTRRKPKRLYHLLFTSRLCFYRAMHFSVKRSLAIICPSVFPSVCDIGASGLHRLEVLETNCTDN